MIKDHEDTWALGMQYNEAQKAREEGVDLEE